MKKLFVLAMVVLLSASLVWASATVKDTKQTIAKNSAPAGKVAQKAISKQAATQPAAKGQSVEAAQGVKGQTGEAMPIEQTSPAQDETQMRLGKPGMAPQATEAKAVQIPAAQINTPFNDYKLQAQKNADANGLTVDQLLQEQNPESNTPQAPEEIKGAVSPNSELMLQIMQAENNDMPNNNTPIITTTQLLYQDFHAAGWSLDNVAPLGGWAILDSGSEGSQLWTYDKWHKFYYAGAGWGDTVAADMWGIIYTDSVVNNWMITPSFDLSTAVSCSLNFKQYFRIQKTSIGDTAKVLVSVDNGGTWSTVWYCADSTSLTNPSFTGLNLNDYVGESNTQVKIAFQHFIAIAPTGGNTVWTNGWMLDNITVVVDGNPLWLQDFSNVMSGWNGDTPPSGPGGGWTILNQGVGCFKATNANDWNRRWSGPNGNLCNDTVAACTRTGGYHGEIENEWLISPMFSINSVAQCSLSLNESWQIDAAGTYWPPNTVGVTEHAYIRIQQTTDGGATWGPWQLISDHNATALGSSNGCPPYTGRYDLTAWRGMNVRLGFQKVGPPELTMGTWYIKHVLVQQFIHDIAVTQFVAPAVGVLRTGVATPMQVYYKNVGDTALTFDATMVVNDSLANVYTTSVTGQTLNSGDSVLVNFGNYTPLAARRHTFNASATVTTPGGDTNPANNALSTWRTTYQHLATGGPDLGSYKWKDSYAAGGPVYNWVDMSGGTIISFTGGNDDGYSGAIALPAPFFYYGNYFSNIYASSNGFLSFTALTSSYASNSALPNSSSPNNTLAALWDDLVISGSAKYLNDVANNRFVVQYDSVYRYQTSTSRGYFQVILNYADSSVVYQYKRISSNFPTGITVGIENAGGTIGLSYFQDGLVPAGLGNFPWDNLAIKFYPDFLMDEIAATAIVSPIGLLDEGGTYAVIGKCSNTGLAEQVFDATMTIKNLESVVYTNTVTGIDLLAGANTNVTFANFVPSATGVDSIFLTVNNPNDQNNANDTKASAVIVNTHDGVGGPDGANYSWIDNTQPGGPTFGMVDMTGALPAVFPSYDDGYLSVPIGHSFFFYGNNFTNVTLETNGYLTFDVLSSSPTYYAGIPDPGVPNNLIAFLRSDLNTRAGCVSYLTDLVNNRFVVNYDSVVFFGTAYYQDVQVILNWGDSTVTVQYDKVSGGGPTHFTVGTENATGMTGLQYYYNATTLGGLGNYPYSGLAIKYYYTAPAADVGITAFSTPNGVLSVGGTYDLTAVALNFTGNQATFDVEFSVDGTPIDTVIGVFLAGNESQQVLCPTQWSPATTGSHTITARTIYTADSTPSNDSRIETRFVFGTAIAPDWANNLDIDNGGFMVGAGPDWAWGAPTYGSGPTAHSAPNVWGTNLAGDYTTNMLNTLYFPPMDLNGTTAPTLKFWMWYRTESGYDGGNVKVSTDGVTWNVITTSLAYNQTGYSGAPGIAGQPVWSGIGTTWTEVQVSLMAYAGQTVLLRFDQSSDASGNYAGMYIDDASLIEPPANDIGVAAVYPSAAGLLIQGYSYALYSKVHNYGTAIQYNVPVSYEIYSNPPDYDNLVYSATITISQIEPGVDSFAVFPGWTAVPDTHLVVSYVANPGDIIPANDTLSGKRYIYPHRGAGAPVEYWSYADNITGGGADYNWVELNPAHGGSGTLINYTDADDGNSGMIPMGMSFEYFGTTYSRINANVNAWVSFTDSTSSAYSNVVLPSSALPNAAIYLDWTDNHLRTNGKVFYFYDAVNNDFIVQYDSVEYISYSGSNHTMEIIFHGNTHSISMQYKLFNITVITNATIGIENQAGTVALAYDNMEIGQTPLPGLAVTWTYFVPPTPIARVVPTSFDESITPGQIVNLSFILYNDGPFSAPPLNFVINSPDEWLQNFFRNNGSIFGGANSTIHFDINTIGLSPNTIYNGNIVISSNDPASPLYLPVTLNTSFARQVGLAQSGDFTEIGVSNYGILGSNDDQAYTYNWDNKGPFDYEGTFILGNSATTMISEYGVGTGTHGFRSAGILDMNDAFHPAATFDDSTLYGGVSIAYKGYGFTDVGSQDFFIHEYIINNNSGAAVNGLYAANFIDWDVGTTDVVTFDRANNVVIQGTAAGPYFGIASVSGPANTLMGVDNDSLIWPQEGWVGDSLYKYVGQNSDVKRHDFTDMSSMTSVGPFDLGIAQVETVAFAIIGGASPTDISTRAALAHQVYLDMNNSRIAVTPDAISHTLEEGTTGYYSPEFTINNLGGQTLIYNPLSQYHWIQFGEITGAIGPGGHENIDVFVDARGIPPGVYADTITINSNDPVNPVLRKPIITVTVTPSGCVYTPGDINGNGTVNSNDIVFAVRYFKGQGVYPPVDCGSPVGPCTEASPFYAEGDVNGNCAFNAIDITFFVRFLKMQVPSILFCEDCAPATPPPPVLLKLPPASVKGINQQ